MNSSENRVVVSLEPSVASTTDDQALWVAIRNRSEAIRFANLKSFLDKVFCQDDPQLTQSEQRVQKELKKRTGPLTIGLNAYTLLKFATEAFLLLNCGVKIDPNLYDEDHESARLANRDPADVDSIKQILLDYLSEGRLPYLDRVASAASLQIQEKEEQSPFCVGVLATNISDPCLLELIWSYWHEECYQVQAMKAISLRFQNRRLREGRDPLAHLAIDPLRPLSNLLWGYIQDEPHQLSVRRRAHEYDHQYGFRLEGKAVPKLQTPDGRPKFVEAFHSLLNTASRYFREASDATKVPDGFPLLNALKEVHIELSLGAHNQFRDLTWTARVEMLIEQWLLARPEMKDFLGGRVMVPYPEDWMGRIDTMNKLQGWSETSVRHFYDLAVFGEGVVLSVRYGDWSEVTDESQAKNWANYWRQEIQGYIHAYRAVTGADLGADLSDTGSKALAYALPSELLKTRRA